MQRENEINQCLRLITFAKISFTSTIVGKIPFLSAEKFQDHLNKEFYFYL